MKQYKLIKKYPGLAPEIELGDVVTYKENLKYYVFKTLTNIDYHFGRNMIENFPEFWQEIIEYPVGTKVRDTNPNTEGSIYEKLSNGFWKLHNRDNFVITSDTIGKGKRFEVVNDFILPEKWEICINNEEEAKIYRDFFESKVGKKWDYTIGFVYGFNGKKYTSGRFYNYTEITFEQFKKYVLKEEEKNIANYKIDKSFNVIKICSPIENQQEKKEYEILSFINKEGKILKRTEYLHDQLKQHFYDGIGTSLTLNTILTTYSKVYHIHSVRRLSDDVVFTIGDKIKGKSNCICKIDSIELNPNYPQIMFNRLDEGIDLIKATKLKPLFKTEDGVDIYTNDKYYFVVISDLQILDPYTVKEHIADWDNTGKYVKPPLGGKQFSTKEKAENFILKNKPCLSYNDIIELNKGETLNCWFSNDDLKTKIKEKCQIL